MQLSKLLAKHFREVIFGGNWTWSNLQDGVKDVTWQQAVQKVESFHTIAVLVFHIHYFIEAILKVLQNQPLDSHDKESFNLPPITSQEDWESLLTRVWEDAELFANLVEQLPEEQFSATFVKEKYGDYYRNIQGVIEHTHYHLGQIVVLKQLLSNSSKTKKDAIEKA
ncbi:MAG: DinB family protein [Bacteroidota bacterium]